MALFRTDSRYSLGVNPVWRLKKPPEIRRVFDVQRVGNFLAAHGCEYQQAFRFQQELGLDMVTRCYAKVFFLPIC